MTDTLDTETVLQEARELLRFYQGRTPSKPYTCSVLADCIAEIERLRAASEWRDISTALEPFVRAAEIIASRPQDYKDRIVAIGGLATAADLTKRHFSDLLTALPAPPQRNEVTKPNLEEPRG